MIYYPEGVNLPLRKKFVSVKDVSEAIKSKEIFEGRVFLCDSEHNLHIDLGCCEGIIPRTEGALGILENTQKDIALISKVGKYVCFRIMGFSRQSGKLKAVLSRRNVQLSAKSEFSDKLRTGDIVKAKVTKLETFGAFIDYGAGLNSLIPIDMLSVSRINKPSQRLCEGEIIKAVLLKRETEKLTFSLRELLGTWEENANMFCAGETVTGIVRSVESYGVFVELTPNLAGLAEPDFSLEEGQAVSVYIKSVNRDKMKIKLSVVDSFEKVTKPEALEYFVKGTHIDYWQYSPKGAVKQVFTEF